MIECVGNPNIEIAMMGCVLFGAFATVIVFNLLKSKTEGRL